MSKGFLSIFAFILSLYIFSAGASAQKNENVADPEAQEKIAAEEKSSGLINRIKVKLVNNIIRDNFPREFNFEKMNVSIFGFSAEFFNLRISENPNFGAADFFTTGHASCNIEFLPFLFDRLNIEEITVDSPVINIIRDSEGSLSLVDLLKSVEKKKALVDWMQISEMNFKDGRARLLDRSQRNGPVTLEMDQLELALEDFRQGRTCGITVSGRLPGSDVKNFIIKCDIGPMQNNQNINEIHIDADVSASDISIEPYRIFIPDGLPFTAVSGRAGANINVEGIPADVLTVVGELNFSDLVLANSFDHLNSKSSALTIVFNDKTIYKPAAGFWEFNGTELIFNDHKYTVNGILKGIHKMSEWNVDIKSQNVSFEDIRKIYPRFNEIIPLTAEFTGAMDIEMIVVGDLNSSNGSIKMGIDNVEVMFFDMIQKQKGSPAFVELRGEKTSKNILNINGNFFFKELEVLRVDIINSVIENLFDKLVSYSSFMAYGKKIKEAVQQYLKIMQTEKIFYRDIVGGYNFSSYALDVKEIELPYIEMTGPVGIEIIVKGVIPLKPEGVDFKVKMYLPKDISQNFVKAAEPLKILLTTEGKLMLPVDVKGSFQRLDITLDMEYIARILKQKGVL